MKLTLDKIRKGLKSNTSKPISTDTKTKSSLRAYGAYYKKAVKSGESFVEKSTKTYGGSPLPWE